MGDQNMATFDDADWSEDSRMDECDPNVHFHAAAAKPYEITGDTGKPEPFVG